MPKADALVCPEHPSICTVLSHSFYSNQIYILPCCLLFSRSQSCLLRDVMCCQVPERAKLQCHILLVLGSEWSGNYPLNFLSSLPNGLAKIRSESSGKRGEFRLYYRPLQIAWKECGSRTSLSCEEIFLLFFMHTASPFLLSFLSYNRINDLSTGPCAVPGQLITHQVISFLMLSSTRTIIL